MHASKENARFYGDDSKKNEPDNTNLHGLDKYTSKSVFETKIYTNSMVNLNQVNNELKYIRLSRVCILQTKLSKVNLSIMANLVLSL